MSRAPVRVFLALTHVLATLSPCFETEAAEPARRHSGLSLTITSADGTRDVVASESVALYVSRGDSPTPFLPMGGFTARWDGALRVDLRDDYLFQAEGRGDLRLEVNGSLALETTLTEGMRALSKPVRLNQGANSIQVTLTSPPQSETSLRMQWAQKPFLMQPLSGAVLSHDPTPALFQADQLRLGRQLVVESRCHKCHAGLAPAPGMPEFAMDAPTFEGIGARRRSTWMRSWILNPKASRRNASMPAFFHGDTAAADAEAAAAFLASLTSAPSLSISEPKLSLTHADLSGGAPRPGERGSLFQRLLCTACHQAPGTPDPAKMSLLHVREKFPAGKLEEFLRRPEAHYLWIRMPNFELSPAEARELADSLLAAAPPSRETSAPADTALVARGQRLIQTRGCLNCHSLALENLANAPKLENPAPEILGCLGPEATRPPNAPAFAFTQAERAALAALLATDRAALGRHDPAEFAGRQSRLLQCSACHGGVDGLPPLNQLGGRLKPEWSSAFMAGDIDYKPRAERHPGGDVWLEARMPKFKSSAKWLGPGLAAQHGFPPKTPAERPIDLAAAERGRALVGRDAGFSCISCHGVGAAAAAEVVDSEGINLARSWERLLRPYFDRWMRSPISIDPATKMPAYFDDEGVSPLGDIHGGDALKQIDDLWHYLRLGAKMEPALRAP